MQGLAFIDQADAYLGFWPGSSGSAPLLFEGAWDVAGSDWSFTPSSVVVNASGGVPIAGSLCGSGTVAPRSQFQGSYALFSCSDPPTSFSMNYSNANALAVAPGDLAATWVSGQVAIAIDVSGVVSGSASGPGIGDCTVSGNVVPKHPGTSKNFFSATIALADVTPSSCFLVPPQGAYQGYGAITFTDTGTSGSPYFVRTFTLLARASNGGWFAMRFVKQ